MFCCFFPPFQFKTHSIIGLIFILKCHYENVPMSFSSCHMAALLHQSHNLNYASNPIKMKTKREDNVVNPPIRWKHFDRLRSRRACYPWMSVCVFIVFLMTFVPSPLLLGLLYKGNPTTDYSKNAIKLLLLQLFCCISNQPITLLKLYLKQIK